MEKWQRSKQSLCSLRVETEKKIEDSGALTLQVHTHTHARTHNLVISVCLFFRCEHVGTQRDERCGVVHCGVCVCV